MIEYKCVVCSRGESAYIFKVGYTDGSDGAATRCPRCGTLADSKDVKFLRQTHVEGW